MRPCEVGLRQTRTSWGLRLTRPGLALGGVPRPDGAAGVGPSVVYMTRGADPCGPARYRAVSEGAVGFGDLRRVPVDAGGVVVVPGLDGADRVALGGECVVVVRCVEVSDDRAVAQLGHFGLP
jgi:hypothetical protein